MADNTRKTRKSEQEKLADLTQKIEQLQAQKSALEKKLRQTNENDVQKGL